MSVGGWALLGFALWAAVELMREVDNGDLLWVRRLAMLVATVCLLVAYGKHVGALP